MIHKNGMDCSCAGFGVCLLSVHLYSGVFSGPSKTMDSTQFHVLFLYSAILPPEPKLEYRIGENILVPLFLNEITFCQHTLVACDGLCTAQFIFPHYGDGVEAVFTVGYSTKHGSLGSSQVLGVVHEQRHVGVYQLAGTDFDNLICHFFRRTAPDEIAQLLQIPRMAFHDVAQLFCLLFADFFVRPVEGIDDEGHPFLFLYLLQEQYLSEAVEGVRRIV